MRGFAALVLHNLVFCLHLFFYVLLDSSGRGCFPAFFQGGFFRRRKVFIARKQIVNYEVETQYIVSLGIMVVFFCLV